MMDRGREKGVWAAPPHSIGNRSPRKPCPSVSITISPISPQNTLSSWPFSKSTLVSRRLFVSPFTSCQYPSVRLATNISLSSQSTAAHCLSASVLNRLERARASHLHHHHHHRPVSWRRFFCFHSPSALPHPHHLAANCCCQRRSSSSSSSRRPIKAKEEPSLMFDASTNIITLDLIIEIDPPLWDYHQLAVDFWYNTTSRGAANQMANSNRKASLFNRWKQQAQDGLEGVSEEEVIEFREAFRLFDKVGWCLGDRSKICF